MLISSLFLRTHPQSKEFLTHNNYAQCLASLMSATTIRYSPSLLRRTLPHVDTKKNLISLTKKSLEDEYQIVQADAEYSYACTSWLPIKTYYLLFNLLLTAEYIITLQPGAFSYTHAKCMRVFTHKLERGELQFSNPILNQVFDESIFNFRSALGANLTYRTDSNILFKLAMKKVAQYKLKKWKEDNNINLRTAAGRREMEDYLNRFKISVFEFPFYMRLRANYNDMAFIGGVPTQHTKDYFENYYQFSMEFSKALKALNNNLGRART